MNQSAVAEAIERDLNGRFGGDLIQPGDEEYDEARKVFNGMIDKRPAVIARCASTDDVAAAVNFARDNDLVIAVRSGGHSVAGMSICEDGILIDLAGMKDIEIDPDAKTAKAGGGLLWGEFDAATQEHGLHTPGGRVTTTGVGGFTTGGGYGWTSSKHGLTCDNLISAEVVTADGNIVTASESENDDLFWGIRGASGNFGIVTTFEFQLHDLGPMVFAGLLLFPFERAPEVMRAWRDFADKAPDEVSSACVALTAPPEEFVPDQFRGRQVLGIGGMYVGDPEKGAKAFQPIKDLGPEVDLMQPMPYAAFQAILDPSAPHGLRNYWRGEYLSGLSDEAIDTYLENAARLTSPFTQIIVFRLGGGVSDVADEDTAFSHRDADYLFHPITVWEDAADDQRFIEFNREFCDAMRPFSTGGAYLNFTPDLDRIRDAYGEEKYERLVELKDKYDPENLFQHNQNIAPSGLARAG